MDAFIEADFSLVHVPGLENVGVSPEVGRIYNRKTGRWLHPFQCPSGGYQVNIKQDQKYIKRCVHRLVWMAAHQRDIPEGHFVVHVNGDRSDNRAVNLKLIHPSEDPEKYKRW